MSYIGAEHMSLAALHRWSWGQCLKKHCCQARTLTTSRPPVRMACSSFSFLILWRRLLLWLRRAALLLIRLLHQHTTAYPVLFELRHDLLLPTPVFHCLLCLLPLGSFKGCASTE